MASLVHFPENSRKSQPTTEVNGQIMDNPLVPGKNPIADQMTGQVVQAFRSWNSHFGMSMCVWGF